jgi:hypothetical protein
MKKARLSHCTRTPALRRIAVTGEMLSLHALNSKSPGTIRLGASGSQPEGRSKAEINGNTRKPSAAVLEQLFGALDQVTAASHPRTFKLLQSGRRKLARKLIEEACEVTVESVKASLQDLGVIHCALTSETVRRSIETPTGLFFSNSGRGTDP